MTPVKIDSALAAANFLRPKMKPTVEEFWALALNCQQEVLNWDMVFRGTVDQCLFHPRDLFRFAFCSNASHLIVAHNHPCGPPEPSPQDLAITQRIIVCAQIFGLTLNDHVIITPKGFKSLANTRWWSTTILASQRLNACTWDVGSRVSEGLLSPDVD